MKNYAFETYAELFEYLTLLPDNPHFLNYVSEEQYHSISTRQFEQRVNYLALALQDIGIQKNDCVALFAKPSPCWLAFDFALQLIGAISVPLFEDISQKNFDFELQDSHIQTIFTDHTRYIYDIPDEILIIGCNIKAKNKRFITIQELIKKGESLCATNSLEIDTLIHQVKKEDIFSIVYTSGNTGLPKGVELTHDNIISQLHDINDYFKVKSHYKALSFLPLAHIFQRTVMSFYLSHNLSIYFVDDVQNIGKLIKEVQPHIITVVPRLLEKIFAKIEEKVNAHTGFKGFLAKKAFQRALVKTPQENSVFDFIYQKLVYSKFLESFGENLEIVVTGGASLNKQLYQFFLNIGLPVYQGYGLTETSPVISVNYPHNNKAGTCGKTLPHVKVKLASDNELLVKSPGVMKGYKNQPILTQEAIDKEGWFHTGDLATIDEEGYITIQSRKKELLKTSTGEYINAVLIEQELCKSNYIDYAVIIANNRKYVSALLFVNQEVAKEVDAETFYASKSIQELIQKHVNSVNYDLNKWEKVIKYSLITQKISIDTGELTPSMKIRKNEVEKIYHAVIETMY
ncbi:MAG: long-chain fatty acid--CoA ligase [Arcobacteraceae bacterium]|nr:long-chain fatty acid--CoA ligase [Arcobacteraceae bacterium]